MPLRTTIFLEQVSKYKDVVDFAEKAHEGQLRDDGEKFILHPLRVFATLLDNADATYSMGAATLLHDVVEDTDYTLEDIEKRFGSEIARLVDGLTNKFEKKHFTFLNRKNRKHLEFERLSQECREVKLIKMADRIDNLRSLIRISGRDGWVKKYREESKQLYEAIKLPGEKLTEILKNELWGK